MLALVNGMDAANYKWPNNLTACFGYPILLSSGMDAVKSPNLMDDSSCQGMDVVNYKDLII